MRKYQPGRQRRAAILMCIIDFLHKYGRPPTGREIEEETGIPQSSAVYHLKRMEELGMIRRVPGRARAIHILKGDVT